MDIHIKKIAPEACSAQMDEFTGNVLIRYAETGKYSGTTVLAIDSPMAAHRIREAVNAGVDIYLKNKRKGL